MSITIRQFTPTQLKVYSPDDKFIGYVNNYVEFMWLKIDILKDYQKTQDRFDYYIMYGNKKYHVFIDSKKIHSIINNFNQYLENEIKLLELCL